MTHPFRAAGPVWRWSLLLLPCLAAATAQAADPEDLTELPFEQLLQREIVSASRMARQISDSPSAVAIVTADDIRAYGYRSLADVINSMRGLYTTYDRRYEYMGGRGFGRPGDYTGRVMLLIDGYATQDSLYNQAYIDDSGLLDLELVERVEYVPGTGSVTYGNNALLGIINVVTKKGRDFNGTQLSTEVSSHGGRKQRATLGKRFENGSDLLLSVSESRSKGQDLYFPGYDAPATNRGMAQGIDGSDARRVFAKLEYEGLVLEAGYADRKKNVPTNPVRTLLFNTPMLSWDTNAFISAKYENDISLDLKAATHFYHGYYSDQAFRNYDMSQFPVTDVEKYRRNQNKAQWWGLDQKFVGNWWTDHTVVFGFEYRDDYQQDFKYEYLTASMALNSTTQRAFSRKTYSLYATDEYIINNRWRINVGGRIDKASDINRGTGREYSANLSPRLALIYTPSAQTTWKASYSEAFRLPNADDRNFYGAITPPERVKAAELVLQHQFSPQTRLTSSLYQYRLADQTYTDAADVDHYDGRSRTKGIEVEIEQQWSDGSRLRSSVAHQQAHGVDDLMVINSPRFLGKFNYTFLSLGDAMRTGIEAHYLGARETLTRRKEAGTAIANLTFSSERKWHGLSASFSIRNLFDNRYDAVAPFTRTSPSGVVQDSFVMDGRTYWLQVNLDL